MADREEGEHVLAVNVDEEMSVDGSCSLSVLDFCIFGGFLLLKAMQTFIDLRRVIDTYRILRYYSEYLSLLF